MRIGIDTSCWINPRGYGRFTRELLKAMVAKHRDHEYVFVIDSAALSKCQFPAGVKVIVAPVKTAATRAASHEGSRSLWDILSMSRLISKEPLDIIFYPSVYTYFPAISKAKKIITIHDAIPETYPELVFPNLRTKFFWRLKMLAALRQADLILTVSEHSKDEIKKYFNVPTEKITVTNEAADPIFVRKSLNGTSLAVMNKYGLTERDRYFLYVGGIGPHKNLMTLIQAHRELRRRIKVIEQKLVIVGDFDSDTFWMDHEIRGLAKKKERNDGIVFTGYIPDEELPYFYSRAEACILPSFSEGFGLPAIEAMACKTAVIASNSTSLPEVVGEAGLFFDPGSPEELAKRMEEVYCKPSLKTSLEKSALDRSKSFTWESAAATVIGAMTNLVG